MKVGNQLGSIKIKSLLLTAVVLFCGSMEIEAHATSKENFIGVSVSTRQPAAELPRLRMPAPALCSSTKYTTNCDPESPFNALDGVWMGTGRGIGGIAYMNWTFPKPIDGIQFNINFHTTPQGPEKSYIQLYESQIGGVHQYFGFQYYLVNGVMETGFIWSRWGLSGCSPGDEAAARRLVAPNPNPNHMKPGASTVVAFGKNDGEPHCAPWVGIRYPYKWSKGKYVVHLAKTATKGSEDWFEVRIYDEQLKTWTSVGKMSFPNGSRTGIKTNGASWSEIYAGVKTSEAVSYFHYSLQVSGFQKDSPNSLFSPSTVGIYYGAQAYGVDGVPNADASLKPTNGRIVHVRYGDRTLRRTSPQTFSIP